MYLYHYYDKRSGPFRSLTALSAEQSNLILEQMKKERPDSMCAKRDLEYIKQRRNCEAILRREFAKKGGKEYRNQVYTYEEILRIIDRYGLPQEWNDDGAHGPERYIEAHVWTNEPISQITKIWIKN